MLSEKVEIQAKAPPTPESRLSRALAVVETCAVDERFWDGKRRYKRCADGSFRLDTRFHPAASGSQARYSPAQVARAVLTNFHGKVAQRLLSAVQAGAGAQGSGFRVQGWEQVAAPAGVITGGEQLPPRVGCGAWDASAWLAGATLALTPDEVLALQDQVRALTDAALALKNDDARLENRLYLEQARLDALKGEFGALAESMRGCPRRVEMLETRALDQQAEINALGEKLEAVHESLTGLFASIDRDSALNQAQFNQVHALMKTFEPARGERFGTTPYGVAKTHCVGPDWAVVEDADGALHMAVKDKYVCEFNSFAEARAVWELLGRLSARNTRLAVALDRQHRARRRWRTAYLRLRALAVDALLTVWPWRRAALLRTLWTEGAANGGAK